VQAALDGTASSQPHNWERGLSSLVSAYAAPRLSYHILCSDCDEPDVCSFDTALDMLHHLRRRYRIPEGEGKVEEEGEARSDAEVEAECCRLLRQNISAVIAAQEDEEDGEASREYPFDEEIAALHAERITLESDEVHAAAVAAEAEWSASTCPPLSAQLSSLQPPFVLFQQSNLSYKGMWRSPWDVQWFDSADSFINALSQQAGIHPAADQEDIEKLQLVDLLRRAVHISEVGNEWKGTHEYLSAVFHRARKV